MSFVRPKKQLGQHFLKDLNIARKIVDSLGVPPDSNVLEIGPGMGVLTQFLLQKPQIRLSVIDVDIESVDYLKERFSDKDIQIIHGDFLKMDTSAVFPGAFSVIGNFPYNISSQIFFRILEQHDSIPCVVGMVQKEVAERIREAPGSKVYGILSVLLQAFYDIDYLFTVSEHVFVPPPKVKSAVIRLTRNQRQKLDCDEKLFPQVVKMAFNQRRKMLGNALKQGGFRVPSGYAGKRAEELSVDGFIDLTRQLQQSKEAES